MQSLSPVFLISGAPGSGKTSVARALAQRFKLSLHIPVDDLREWVVSGIVYPIPARTPEAERQLRLARQTAAYMASLYAEAGFVTVIDDVLFPTEARELFEESLGCASLYKVLLQPSWEVVLERNLERGNGRFDAAQWTEPMRAIYQALAAQRFVESQWLVLDSSSLNIKETVTTILEHTLHGSSPSSRGHDSPGMADTY